MVHLVKIERKLLHRIEEIAFEAIEGLERKPDALFRSDIAGCSMEGDAALALFGRRPRA